MGMDGHGGVDVERGAVADSVAPWAASLALRTGPGRRGKDRGCPFAVHATNFFNLALTPLCCASVLGPHLRPLGSVMLGFKDSMALHSMFRESEGRPQP